MIEPDPTSKHSWDALGEQWLEERPQQLWRAYSDRINTNLARRWLPPRIARLLKTDLFDEAVGPGIVPELAPIAEQIFGVDLSSVIVQAARARHPTLVATACDLRHLPFEDRFFDGAVSFSSLDHFDDPHEIELALLELHRVLKPRARLVITMDNPQNPVVWLRARVPFSTLNNLGLMPYYCGPTLSLAKLAATCRRLGFMVERTTVIQHCPRLAAITMSRGLEGRLGPRARAALVSTLAWLEAFERTPLKKRTGYFVAACCRRS